MFNAFFPQDPLKVESLIKVFHFRFAVVAYRDKIMKNFMPKYLRT